MNAGRRRCNCKAVAERELRVGFFLGSLFVFLCCQAKTVATKQRGGDGGALEQQGVAVVLFLGAQSLCWERKRSVYWGLGRIPTPS